MSENGQLRVKDDAGCFVCGRENPIGLKAVFSVDEERHTSYARVTLGENFQGWQDVVHGGILATLLDEACVYACRTLANQCVTADIQVRYRQPVPVGSQVEVHGALLDQRRTVWRARGRIEADGVVYAEAETRIFILDRSVPGAGSS